MNIVYLMAFIGLLLTTVNVNGQQYQCFTVSGQMYCQN